MAEKKSGGCLLNKPGHHAGASVLWETSWEEADRWSVVASEVGAASGPHLEVPSVSFNGRMAIRDCSSMVTLDLTARSLDEWENVRGKVDALARVAADLRQHLDEMESVYGLSELFARADELRRKRAVFNPALVGRGKQLQPEAVDDAISAELGRLLHAGAVDRYRAYSDYAALNVSSLRQWGRLGVGGECGEQELYSLSTVRELARLWFKDGTLPGLDSVKVHEFREAAKGEPDVAGTGMVLTGRELTIIKGE